MRRRRRRRCAALDQLLQALHLLFELLIVILQLLDLTSQVANRLLHAVNASDQLGVVLGARRSRAQETDQSDKNIWRKADHDWLQIRWPKRPNHNRPCVEIVKIALARDISFAQIGLRDGQHERQSPGGLLRPPARSAPV